MGLGLGLSLSGVCSIFVNLIIRRVQAAPTVPVVCSGSAVFRAVPLTINTNHAFLSGGLPVAT